VRGFNFSIINCGGIIEFDLALLQTFWIHSNLCECA
jgi:hypothetical protein